MNAHAPLRPGKYRLRVGDYQLLADAGVFGDARTELIDGDVRVMSPQYRPHAWLKDELAYRIRSSLEAQRFDLAVLTEVSVAIDVATMPQPDIVLTRLPKGVGAVPVASVAVLVEVSDTTLHHDLNDKQRIYAMAGVPEYWVADVMARVIHQLWSPGSDSYAERRLVPFDDALTAVTVPGLMIPTALL